MPWLELSDGTPVHYRGKRDLDPATRAKLIKMMELARAHAAQLAADDPALCFCCVAASPVPTGDLCEPCLAAGCDGHGPCRKGETE